MRWGKYELSSCYWYKRIISRISLTGLPTEVTPHKLGGHLHQGMWRFAISTFIEANTKYSIGEQETLPLPLKLVQGPGQADCVKQQIRNLAPLPGTMAKYALIGFHMGM